MYTILCITLFVSGFILGLQVKSILFSKLDWNVLKWDPDVFAYRPAPKGSKIKPGDKVYMALKVPTSKMPKEGLKYE